MAFFMNRFHSDVHEFDSLHFSLQWRKLHILHKTVSKEPFRSKEPCHEFNVNEKRLNVVPLLFQEVLLDVLKISRIGFIHPDTITLKLQRLYLQLF